MNFCIFEELEIMSLYCNSTGLVMWLLFLVVCLAAGYWHSKTRALLTATFSLRFEDWQLTSSPHVSVLILINSKRTPSRQWSCATTSPSSVFIKRPSSSSSTFQSHPTFWGLSLTPRSKDTERWMCENGFKKRYYLMVAEGANEDGAHHWEDRHRKCVYSPPHHFGYMHLIWPTAAVLIGFLGFCRNQIKVCTKQ